MSASPERIIRRSPAQRHHEHMGDYSFYRDCDEETSVKSVYSTPHENACGNRRTDHRSDERGGEPQSGTSLSSFRNVNAQRQRKAAMVKERHRRPTSPRAVPQQRAHRQRSPTVVERTDGYARRSRQ